MGLGRTLAGGVLGIEGFLVRVEADVSNGLPTLTVTGRPDPACAQAADRVKAAANNSGQPVPSRRVTVNLSPASVPKVGSGFDLGIAIAVLAAAEVVTDRVVARVLHLGELGLDGTVRAVTGVLPAVSAAAAQGVRHVVVPIGNAAEARLVEGVRVHPVAHLGELVARYQLLDKGGAVPEVIEPPTSPPARPAWPDLADIAGMAEGRLAVEVAAAGGHHVYFVGPPGAGKSMLAERLPGILPDLDERAAMEVTQIASVLGTLERFDDLCRRPPFVAPHHGASSVALIGGGTGGVRPGAITQAHRGVLFLDEAPEFRTHVLQCLRQPLENGYVVVARAAGSYRFPAQFQLVLAANPCPCGNAIGKGAMCSCPPSALRRYAGRLAGPLLDRVDLQVHVPAARSAMLTGTGESSAVVAQRVRAAREVQGARWGGAGHHLNARVPGPMLRRAPYRLPGARTVSLERALDRGVLSMRGYDRCLRLAWTIADLAGRVSPSVDDVGLAISLRQQQERAA